MPSRKRATHTRIQFALLTVVVSLLVAWPAVAAPREWIYAVKSGDTLIEFTQSFLARQHTWQEVKERNGVGNVRRIPPGMLLRIPVDWLKPEMLARLVAAKGEVRRKEENDNPLQAGDLLVEGESIETGPDSSALIEFADGSRIFALANSTLKVERLRGSGKGADVRLTLDAGRVETQVKKRSPRSPFQIKTPAAQIGVRGTAFRVATAPGGRVTSEVTEGSVGVAGSRGSVAVPAGYGTVAEADRPPLPPQPLLPAPSLDAQQNPLTRLPVRLRWPEVAGAHGYRVQATPDQEGALFVVDQTFPGAEARLGDLPDGDYHIKVRAIDDKGLEGLDTMRTFTVFARPEPPAISAPEANRTLRTDRPQFHWAKVEGIASYRLEIARAASFSDVVVVAPAVEVAGFKPERALEPGDYYWRIASRDAAGRLGPSSDVQKFTYKPPSPAAQAEPPAIDDESLRFRWGEGEPGAKYRFQLAGDKQFGRLLVDQTLDAPQIQVPNPGGGTYYLRIQTIEADGYEGQFGPAQEVQVPQDYRPLLLLLLAVPFLF